MTNQPERGHGLSVGAVVADTYQVTGLLGRGGMGSVWEASHLRLPGKRVAIKVLHADIAADQEALARFRREAEIATRLGHPNIVEVHDFNTLPDGQPYLVLELLVGEALDSRLRRAPVSVDDAMRIAGQIGAALSAAHREQVIHRDLKPQNVFLVRPRDDGDGSGELVKVLDFGISKIRGSQTVKTLDSTLLGTPQYMAPEQATGNHAAVDQRTDVFALGAIVYEMLVGRPAFTGQSIPEVVFKVVYEQPPPLADLVPGLPRRVIDAVERALAKVQDERFPDVVSFVEEMAGVSLSTLRRAPISLGVPRGARPTGMESTMAASGSGRSTPAPGGQRAGAGGAGGAGGADQADPLGHTVDSGRREMAALVPPTTTQPTTRPLPLPLESMGGPVAQGSSMRGEVPDPAPGAAMQASAPAPHDQPGRRRGRRIALLVAALLLLAGGGATIALVARTGGDGEARSAAARSGRGKHARRARTAEAAASPSEPGPAVADPAQGAAQGGAEQSGVEPADPASAEPSSSSPSSPASPASEPKPPVLATADGPPRPRASPPLPDDARSAAPDHAAAPGGDARFSQLRPTPPRKPDRARGAPGRAAAGDAADPDGTDASGQSGDEPRGELRAALADGEQALRSGDFRGALVIAERALRHGAGPAAHALRARASCGIGDLGNAKASYLRIPRRNRILRRLVAASCTRAGVDLGP